MPLGLWRVRVDGAVRLARGDSGSGPHELLPGSASVAALLGGPPDALPSVLTGAADGPVPQDAAILAPVDRQEVWAAGVTYLRSRDARKEESAAADAYDRVYDAERPELFFKAAPGRARGPGEPIGVRVDSGWDVPEPELGVVADCRGAVVGYVVGNDVSSRRIEGENTLYLPQAKIYTGSCALGPCIVPAAEAPEPAEMTITLEVHRRGQTVVDESVRVADMRRSIEELVAWLFRAQGFSDGVVLLTGTAVVPDPTFTLQSGDEVSITITGLGTLTNPVEVVGATP